jgi:hypothetical protein
MKKKINLIIGLVIMSLAFQLYINELNLYKSFIGVLVSLLVSFLLSFVLVQYLRKYRPINFYSFWFYLYLLMILMSFANYFVFVV